jgi:hypothetical protein
MVLVEVAGELLPEERTWPGGEKRKVVAAAERRRKMGLGLELGCWLKREACVAGGWRRRGTWSLELGSCRI